ncbi:MAG: hypothetical protein ACM3JD_06445 [Rudaea sp.]
MSEQAPLVRIRPFVVRQIALALGATGLLLLVIALLAFSAIVLGLSAHSLNFSLMCAYLLLFVCGLAGGLLHLLMARSFYAMNKIAYKWVRSTSWNPLVALVSQFGRALDDPAVVAAFGVETESSFPR